MPVPYKVVSKQRNICTSTHNYMLYNYKTNQYNTQIDVVECAAADIGSTISPRQNPSFLFMSPYKILSKVTLIVEHDSSNILTEIIKVNVRLIWNIIFVVDKRTMSRACALRARSLIEPTGAPAIVT